MRLVILSWLLISTVKLSCAIYGDDAYQIDFHHALLGKPEPLATFFHRPSSTSPASLLYTLTELGVLGAVNPKDGSVVWRHRLGLNSRHYAGQASLKACQNLSIIASTLDNHLRVYNAANGRLAWEWQSNDNITFTEIISHPLNPTVAIIERLRDGAEVVRAFDAENGTLRWHFVDSSGDIGHSLIQDGREVTYISLRPSMLKGYKIRVTILNAANGHEADQDGNVILDREVPSATSILYAGRLAGLPIVVWTDKGQKTIRLGSLRHSKTFVLPFKSYEDFAIERVKVVAPSAEQRDPSIMLHMKGREKYTARIYNFDSALEVLNSTHDLPIHIGDGVYTVSFLDTDLYFLHHTRDNLSLIESKSAKTLQTWSLISNDAAVNRRDDVMTHAEAEIVRKGNSKVSVRYAHIWASGDWEMAVNGEVAWVRSEGITGVIAAAFANAAIDGSFDEDLDTEVRSNALRASYHRFRRHLNGVRSLAFWLLNWLTKQNVLLSKLASVIQIHDDRFGFAQVVIIVTKTGRVAALDLNRDGRVLWNVGFARATDKPLEHVAIKIVDNMTLIKLEDGNVIYLDVATGQTVGPERFDVVKSKHLRTPANQDRPPSRQARSETTIGLPNEVFEKVELDLVEENGSQKLKAWSVSPHRARVPIWEFGVPPRGQIVSFTRPPPHDPVASIGRVLGDRSVLYKYLNPNLLVITSLISEANVVTFYVLDTQKGEVLYSTSRSEVDVEQPISACVSENMLAFSLVCRTNDQAQGGEHRDSATYQLTIADMYTSSLPNDRGSCDNRNGPYQKLQHEYGQNCWELPHVITQTYLLREPVHHLTFSSTLQGITPRSLLGTTLYSNAIFTVPRYLIDPRRPEGRDPVAAEIEEGLFRHNSILDLDPRWFLNHKREALGFSAILTTPTLLESTSLVFAFGDYDIFGTRLSPIGTFDMLGKGFKRFQLIATVLALAVGTAVLGPMVSRGSPPASAAFDHAN